MVSSKNFAINNGPTAGVYCSYCSGKLKTQKEEDSGAFHYQCTCADAKAEIYLLTQKEELESKLAKFYDQRDKQIKKTQLLKHKTSIEMQLQELASALSELDEDSSPENVSSPRKQLEEIESSPLKMEKPSLPNFNQGNV
jgi:hypothetical protein